MLNKVKDMLKNKEEEFKMKIPMHVAITMNGIGAWAKKNNKTLEEANSESFIILKSTIKSQVRLGIPILTFYLLPTWIDKSSERYDQTLNATLKFMTELSKSDLIINNKVKISILGKWYDLPGRIVDGIKEAIGTTKDYDHFFLNFCINYDGQEEIINACKLIAMNVRAEKLDPDMINKEIIKENLSSSYFVPPNLIIKNGRKKITTGIFLWDSSQSTIYFSDTLWPDFDKNIFMDSIKYFEKDN